MSFPRYPEYKDSGVEWLGEVPAHWEISRLGFEAWVRARLGWKGLKAEEYVDDGIIFLATPNIKSAEIDYQNVNYISDERYDESPEIKLSVGDVLLAKDGSTLGTVNVVKALPGPATVNSSIAVITPFAAMTGRYLRYIFNSSFMEQMIQKTKGGMGVPHLFQADLNKFYIPVPPINDQEAVTTFIDRETAKIDALVAEQEKLIALLQEKRQTVISHAVTKGLDSSVPMKDSGVEWLGEVPAHWEVKSIKWLSPVLRGASPRPIDDPKYFDDDGEYAWVRIADSTASTGVLTETTQRLSALGSSLSVRLEVGQLFVSIAGTVGKPCITAIKACIHDGFVYFPRLQINPKFLFKIFEAGVCYGGLGKMGTQLNLNTDTIGSIRVAVPPPAEIAQVLTFVDQETAKLDTLMSEAQSAITLLQERRTALISAAVTGQIKVTME